MNSIETNKLEKRSSALASMSRDDLINELQQLRQLVVNSDTVARARFEYYGLCDCIDNCGGPYPSQWSHDLILRAKQTVTADPRLKRFAG